jgi:hypothetical protein
MEHPLDRATGNHLVVGTTCTMGRSVPFFDGITEPDDAFEAGIHPNVVGRIKLNVTARAVCRGVRALITASNARRSLRRSTTGYFRTGTDLKGRNRRL